MFPDIRSPKYLPLRTIVKFYYNHLDRKADRNQLISKSLGKTLVIDHHWLDNDPAQVPKDKEFWLVDLVHETNAGEPKGCFLCHPIRQVQFDGLTRLMPGMFAEHWHHDGASRLLVLEPEIGGVDWILPARHRNRIRDAYAIIVQQ
jgi:hypothetical protein